MKIIPFSRDVEQLSAYLDGRLKPSERSRLENRVNTDPELKEILNELRNTRRLLRSLPKARVPRNFTLSPRMAVVKPLRRTYPAMGFVSALASILLVVVLVSDWYGSGAVKLSARSGEALQVFVTMEVEKRAADAGTDVQTPEPMLAMEASPEEALRDESESMTAPAAEAPLMFAAPPAETAVTVGEEIGGTAVVEMKVLEIPPEGAGAAQPTQTITVTEALTGTPIVAQLPTSVETPTESMEAARIPANETSGDAQADGGVMESLPPQPSPLLWLRILEGVLLFTALGAGIMAIRQRVRTGK